MDGRGYHDGPIDKQWASDYILGPLYDAEPSQVCATRIKPLPTPPRSPNSNRDYFSLGYRKTAINTSDDDEDEELPFLRRVLNRTNSLRRKPLPPSPPRISYPPISGLERKRSVHTATPPQTRWNQGTILSRANSVFTTRPSANAMAAVADSDGSRRRASSLAERYPGDKSHRPLEMLTQEHRAREGADNVPRRAGSLRERYPGDMSHRPLAMLTQEHKAADRAPHLRNRHRKQPSDTIDSLDSTGPVPGATYHHGGPFDATLKERNLNKKYAPVEAVKESNLEALKATPAEFVQDSLVKHVPLQGTAIVPPGMTDFGGRRMSYEEGADLMRDVDAPGGPYKRWPTVRYRDDDLKGKGEQYFAAEQGYRGKPRAGPSSGAVYYEMQPSSAFREDSGTNGKELGTHVRQRSASNGDQLLPNVDEAGSSGLQRSNTTGKNLAQSLKRRFGSLRKKRPSDEAGY